MGIELAKGLDSYGELGQVLTGTSRPVPQVPGPGHPLFPRVTEWGCCYWQTHTQLHHHRDTGTHRSTKTTQAHTNTHRQLHPHIDTPIQLYPHTDTCRQTQIHSYTHIVAQTNTDTHTHNYNPLQAHTETHRCT